MTYIPVTGNFTPPETKIIQKASQSEVITVVNVTELIKPKTPEDLDNENGYNQLKYWMVYGSIGSLVFVILAILDLKFLFLLPLGPYVAYLSWHVRKWVKKYSKHFDAFSN